MAPVLVWLILFLCLLISILKYTFALILKWSVPGAVVKKDFTYQPTVSVLMPCFNEGKTVYETIESMTTAPPRHIRCSVPDCDWGLEATDFSRMDQRYLAVRSTTEYPSGVFTIRFL
jgi:hypothetical protein